MILSTCAAAALALLVGAAPSARAAAPSAGMAAVANFRLTDSFLKRDIAYVLDTSDDPCRYSLMSALVSMQSNQASLDQIVSRYDARPGVHAMLAKHGLTAREAVVGSFALMAANMQALSESPGGKKLGVTTSGTPTPTMRANVAFYKAHSSELRQFHAKIGRAARANLQKNGGKLPACMRR
jgi:hypothetical protein